MILPITKTNLLEWFDRTHGAKFILAPPPPKPPKEKIEQTPESKAKFLLEFKAWCLGNTRAKKVTIGWEAIMVEVDVKNAGNQGGNRPWQITARLISKAYVTQNRKTGGSDNYAVCQVIDQDTGKILDSASFLMP